MLKVINLLISGFCVVMQACVYSLILCIGVSIFWRQHFLTLLFKGNCSALVGRAKLAREHVASHEYCTDSEIQTWLPYVSL